MYVCMYGKHFQQSMDLPGTVANPAGSHLNRKKFFPLSPFAPMNLVSRDKFGRPVPRQPAHSLPHSGGIINHQSGSSRFPRRRPYLYRQPPSDQSRVYRVTQLRSDSVHCRGSAGTGPLVLKVVPVSGAAFSGFTIDHFFYAPLFSYTD